MVHILPGRPSGKPDHVSPIRAAIPYRGSVQVRGLAKTTILLAFILATANIEIMLSAYGHDVGLHHPLDAEVEALPSQSTALHRRRVFARRRSMAGRDDGQQPPPPTIPFTSI